MFDRNFCCECDKLAKPDHSVTLEDAVSFYRELVNIYVNGVEWWSIVKCPRCGSYWEENMVPVSRGEVSVHRKVSKLEAEDLIRKARRRNARNHWLPHMRIELPASAERI